MIDMKQGWEVKKLSEVCDFQNGFAFESKTFKTNGIPLLRITNIQNETIDVSNVVYIDPNDYDRDLSRYEVVRGDLLIAMSGATTGKIGVHQSNDVLLLNQRVGKFKPKHGMLKSYMFYYLLTKVEESLSISEGAAQPNLSTEQIKSFQVPIPPLETQKQIVAVLDKAFAAIDLAKANIEKNLQNAKELFQSKLNQIFTQKGEGWEDKKLGDSSLLSIIDGDRGKNYPKKSDFFPEGHCVFMNTGNVRPNGFDFSTVMFITEERDKLLRKGKLQRNDVVMTTRGTIGNLGWFNDAVKYENIRVNSGMLIFRVNQQRILPEYLFTVLRSPVVTKQIEERTSGAAQPQLPIKTLVHFDMPFHPDLDKQRMMVGKIQELESMTDDLIQIGIKKLRSLDELKKSTLQKAFSGELK